ncbi:MAG: hypothetical protein KAQ83_01725 [Nanoarchaeota archaeon]|nr:hypothetical protein [Nanoarchaeota archaeon]
MTDYYVAISYNNNFKNNLEVITRIIESYKDHLSFLGQPLTIGEINPELRPEFQEGIVLNSKEKAQELSDGLKKLDFINDTITGKLD